MQVTYRHYYGAQEEFDLACFTAELTCSAEEEADALAQGWLLNDGRWYQSRSTRIAISSPDLVQISDAEQVHIRSDRHNIAEYQSIYAAYLAAKGFANLYDPFTPSDRSRWLEYRIGDEMVGFTKLQTYEGGLESQYNAYRPDANHRYGLQMLRHEIAAAAKDGLQYLYIGSGYERSSIYKSKITGFQWWTGSQWSDDRQRYMALCKRDSKIKTLKDLAAAHHHKPS